MQKGFSRRRNLDPTKCKKGFEDEEISIQLNVKKGFKRTENLKKPNEISMFKELSSPFHQKYKLYNIVFPFFECPIISKYYG